MIFSKLKPLQVTASCLVGLIVSNSIVAQEIDEEIIVTAARVEQPLSEALVSADVVTRAEIDRIQSRDINETLRSLPGTEAINSGGRGAISGISIRGAEQDQTLFIVDGVRVSSATSGSTAIQFIPPHLIDRIEVVRGPYSALYGADALGGVVQIITKRPEATEPSFYVTTGYGSLQSEEYAAGFALGTEKTSINADISYRDTDGIDRTVSSFFAADSDRDGFDELGANISVQHRLDDNNLLRANFIRTGGTTEFDAGNPNDSTDYIRQNANITYEGTLWPRVTVVGSIGYALDDQETFGFDSTFRTERLSFIGSATYQFADNQSFTGGYEFYNDDVSSTQTFEANERENTAIFTQYAGQFGGFSLQAGLRFDDNEAFGSDTNGNLSLAYRVSDLLRIRANWGTGFRAPTFNDQFFPFTDFSSPGFPFFFQGNPDLEPEESRSFEFALEGANNTLNWSAAIFRTDFDNLIVGSVFVPALNLNMALNVNEATVQGAELAIGGTYAGWRGNLSLTYIDAEDDTTGARLSDRARTQTSLNIGRTFAEDFDFDVSFHTQSDRISGGNELGGFGLVDLAGQYRVTENLTVKGSIRNLFEQEYSIVSGFNGNFRTEGRTAHISATYRF